MTLSLIIWPEFDKKPIKTVLSVAYTNPNVKI